MEQRYRMSVDQGDRKLDQADLFASMREFDVLCPTVSDRIDGHILRADHRTVRLIASYGAGVDHIDLDAARLAGISVSNTPDVVTEATADLALLLMLMASRRAGEGERELRAGRWSGWRPTHMLGQSLSGKLLGLVGFGRIGQATAMRARAIGMRIAYFARSRAASDAESRVGGEYEPSLSSLAARADVLSLHCPGGTETRHLVNAELLSWMKPNAILVNTARGSVLDECALASALASGGIAAAALDVFEDEPIVNAALMQLENAVLLPHLGSATREARIAMGMRVVANIDRFVAGQDLLDRVV